MHLHTVMMSSLRVRAGVEMGVKVRVRVRLADVVSMHVAASVSFMSASMKMGMVVVGAKFVLGVPMMTVMVEHLRLTGRDDLIRVDHSRANSIAYIVLRRILVLRKRSQLTRFGAERSFVGV